MRINNHLNVIYWRDANMALTWNITGYSKGWELLTETEV